MSHPIKTLQARCLLKERCLGHRVTLSRVRKRHFTAARSSLTPAPKHGPHTQCETWGLYTGLSLLTNGYQRPYMGQVGRWGGGPGHGGGNCHQLLSAQHRPESLGEHHEGTGTNSAVAALHGPAQPAAALASVIKDINRRQGDTPHWRREAAWLGIP